MGYSLVSGSVSIPCLSLVISLLSTYTVLFPVSSPIPQDNAFVISLDCTQTLLEVLLR